MQLTISQITNSRLFQIERVCRLQFKFNENGGNFSKLVENTCYKQFLLSVLKDLYCRHLKTRAFLGKG